ncbi:hypothetical protein MVES_000079 [Malassezia vespertilionis]|uniref:Uncharacterized protein n=2 Tax=Malassezia vespertilionis TaxID=2020962 RepID=A0A2N1JG96_9BASI|nr:hypothetical protein MVES_000079 [Malassezia vespertilionis]
MATERDANVSMGDPAEDEAQRFLNMGTKALEVGDLEKAMGEYRNSIRAHENASAYYNLGVCQYQERDLEGAIASWNDALRLAPESPDVHTNLASAYIMSMPSRADLAVEHLRTAAAQSPGDPEIHFNLGAVLEACEMLEEALVEYQRAVEGGIDRAKENVRNCMAKLMTAKLAVEKHEKEGGKNDA